MTGLGKEKQGHGISRTEIYHFWWVLCIPRWHTKLHLCHTACRWSSTQWVLGANLQAVPCACHGVGMHHRRMKRAPGCAGVPRRQRWWHELNTLSRSSSRTNSQAILHEVKPWEANDLLSARQCSKPLQQVNSEVALQEWDPTSQTPCIIPRP